MLFEDVEKEFGFRAGDERALIADERQLAKGALALDVLKRLALAATPDVFAIRGELGLGQGTIELQIEVEALDPESPRQQ